MKIRFVEDATNAVVGVYELDALPREGEIIALPERSSALVERVIWAIETFEYVSRWSVTVTVGPPPIERARTDSLLQRHGHLQTEVAYAIIERDRLRRQVGELQTRMNEMTLERQRWRDPARLEDIVGSTAIALQSVGDGEVMHVLRAAMRELVEAPE